MDHGTEQQEAVARAASLEGTEHPGVKKIKAMWERGDFDTIDKMVRFWEAMENLGILGDMLRRFILWSGIIAGGYLAASGYITDWIRSIARQ
jgi:hypothetical protein